MSSTHIVCGSCDSVVRVPTERLDEAPKCPRCHAALFNGQPIELHARNLDQHLTRSDLPLVVDVWAPWCGPCRMMAPHFESAARQLEPRARFAKINSDEAPELAARFGIRGIPTLLVFKQGREIARQSGAMDATTLMRWLAQVL